MFGQKSAEREIRDGLPALYPRLWRYAMAMSGRRDWAEELAQSACVRALEKADGFVPGTHLDRWIFRLTKRIWLNELRARHIREGAGLVAAEDIDLPAGDPTSEANIFLAEVLSKVNTLPEAQRMTVVLSYVEGYSYRETAEILEIPIGTVMSRLAAARKTLAVLKSDEERHAN